MKADKQRSALEVIKKEQLKRRAFSVEFKAEVVRYKQAENCPRRPKLTTRADCALTSVCRVAAVVNRRPAQPAETD